MNVEKLLKAPRLQVSFIDDAEIDGLWLYEFRQEHNLPVCAVATMTGLSPEEIENIEFEGASVNKYNKSASIILALLKKKPELIGDLYQVSIEGVE